MKTQRKYESKIGPLWLVATERGLCGIHWKRQTAPLGDSPVLDQAERELEEYFAGRRKRFDVVLDVTGTAFQQSVWRELARIPYGETRSYAQIAQRVGSPRAVRAVGTANGRNPVSIIVPCHRVIASSGKLAGYAGGLSVKETLLALEKTTQMRGSPRRAP
jgi:methylated-DNA-[protein]-cysteine S-methyltransferase